MGWTKRFRANWAWGLLFGVIWNEWHQPRRVALILVMAALVAITNSLLDAASERWQWPKRRKRGTGAA